MKSLTKFTLKDSPISICLLTMLLTCLTYLVYMHPQHFEGFFHFVLICGFITLAGLLIAYYRPFVRYYNAFIIEKSRQTNHKSHVDYHEQLKGQTMKHLDELMKTDKYQEFERKMKENQGQPVVLCQNRTIEEIQAEAKELEEIETQIFQEQPQQIGQQNVA